MKKNKRKKSSEIFYGDKYLTAFLFVFPNYRTTQAILFLPEIWQSIDDLDLVLSRVIFTCGKESTSPPTQKCLKYQNNSEEI